MRAFNTNNRSQLLDYDSHFTSDTSRRFVTALRRLSADSDLQPESFALSGIKEGRQVAGGTFGDVHDGMFEGQKVALKVMRVFDQIDIETALKV